MSNKSDLSAELIRQCLRYDNGKLYWLVRPVSHFKNAHGMKIFNSLFPGGEAGSLGRQKGGNRWMVNVFGKFMYRSHVVWIIHNGSWPVGLVDHVNRDTTDDRIENLREVTCAQNSWNTSMGRRNKSGLKGVSWDTKTRKWVSSIMANGSSKHLGSYMTKEEAHAAYCAAAKELHGEFAYTGASE